ncbi:MAG: hypothetical protein KDI01_00850 [Halioglobus sp.]|nr:hypothetical protein [Halioglobus sp.]
MKIQELLTGFIARSQVGGNAMDVFSINTIKSGKTQAQRIAECASSSSNAMDMAEGLRAEIDRDWDNEITTFTFTDNSKLICSGSKFRAT